MRDHLWITLCVSGRTAETIMAQTWSLPVRQNRGERENPCVFSRLQSITVPRRVFARVALGMGA